MKSATVSSSGGISRGDNGDSCARHLHVRVLYCLTALLAASQLLAFVYLRDQQRALESARFSASSRAVSRVRRQADYDEAAALDDAKVEFVSPQVRDEQGKPARKAGDLEEGEQPDKPWVWLTDYARIPLLRMQEFCAATKDYCPPGPRGERGLPGMPGVRGDKGDLGVAGIPGDNGVTGPPGLPGITGPRGPKGVPGRKGLSGMDGLDGLPGEPGLDGIPGRNGLDGFAGVDGIPGRNGAAGRDGVPGINGINGVKGAKGEAGPQGPVGPTGMVGPRGRKGSGGADGVAGVPGINSQLVNSTQATLLIPPWIAKVPRGDEMRSIRVNEGDNLRLRCVAAGVPRPTIQWSMASLNSTMRKGAWKSTSVEERELELIQIHREQRGMYRCTATNGIPPDAHKLYQVTVLFSPLIECGQSEVQVKPGGKVRLQCRVEASPPFVTYWRRGDKVLDSDDQINTGTLSIDEYKVEMTLEIHQVLRSDFGEYYCVGKNERGITEGGFIVSPPGGAALPGRGQRILYGRLPPNITDQDRLCPPVQQPQAPSVTSCRQHCVHHLSGLAAGTMDGLAGGAWPHAYLYGASRVVNVTELNDLPSSDVYNRTMACELSAVGKPVFARYSPHQFGTWLQDALPPSSSAAGKLWATHEQDRRRLFEYAERRQFDAHRASRNITLPHPHQGNGHVIYNGSFYYHLQNSNSVVRYELSQGRVTHRLKLPQLAANKSVTLYGSNYTYVDFAPDENGLWIIYALPSNNIGVVKVRPDTLQPQHTWNISFSGDSHARDGDMFVVCGVLYGVFSTRDSNTKFSLALDLFTIQPVTHLGLTFTNPFRRTTMVGYNPRLKEIFSWDNGNQLAYPIKYIAQDDGGMDSGDEQPSFEALMEASDYDITDPSREEPTDSVVNE